MGAPVGSKAYLIMVNVVLGGRPTYIRAFIAPKPAEDIPVKHEGQVLATLCSTDGGTYGQAYANMLAMVKRSPYTGWLTVKDEGPVWTDVVLVREESPV